MTHYSGKARIEFNRRLGSNWHDLADYFGIPNTDTVRFELGQQGREILIWLQQREKSPKELIEALEYINRKDLIDLFSQSQTPTTPESITILGCPYPGLRAFTENEANLFFGRSPEIEAVLEKITTGRFLAVIGASGSGKSSLVRAGLMPKLRTESSWDWLRFTPGGIGDDPFMALASEMSNVLEKNKLSAREIATQLRQRGNIDELAEKCLMANSPFKELLLFIDQFEELFTLVADDHRQRFVNLLYKAAQSPRVRVILTVRADFHEHCLHYPTLASLINSGAWHLASPDLLALRQMVSEPARAAGLQFESGLIEQILHDTGTGPGVLALMAFTLEQLYRVCAPQKTLSRKAYEDMGGVSQAVGRQAQKTYESLDTESQQALSGVFTELVTVDPERGVPTRKRAILAEINQSDASRNLIDAFTKARLLVQNEINEKTVNSSLPIKQTVVEVAHEAVLTHWSLLKNWIDERFGEFCLLRQVRLESAEWVRNSRPKSDLWPHERLQKVYDMQRTLQPQLSPSEKEFIRPEIERWVEKLNDASLTHQQRERIGMRLTEIDDTRPGVGVDKQGRPQIEWCKVSPGRITLEEDVGTFDVPAFFISKYPVTYRQYRAFLEAEDGYQNDQWWTNLEHEPEPEEQFRKVDNHPAENVSWFDAMAYCRWLGDKLGYEIRLPTEWEWQQAATGGQKKNDYPWGTQFDSDRCNTYESGLGRTTAVGLYPNGKSPVGALDMSGNVWEWCVNCFNNPKAIDVHSKSDRRVVRGGSWYGNLDLARAAYRDDAHPVDRDHYLGFRLVCSSPILGTAGH